MRKRINKGPTGTLEPVPVDMVPRLQSVLADHDMTYVDFAKMSEDCLQAPFLTHLVKGDHLRIGSVRMAAIYERIERLENGTKPRMGTKEPEAEATPEVEAEPAPEADTRRMGLSEPTEVAYGWGVGQPAVLRFWQKHKAITDIMDILRYLPVDVMDEVGNVMLDYLTTPRK